MHDEARAYIEQAVPAGSRILDFGSRDINGSPRNFVDHAGYVGVDIVDGPGVDHVADAGTVQVPGPFDVVVCCEVFEHADDAACQAICRNAHRHLPAGGLFVMTMAGPGREPHSAVDGGELRDGEFYRNVTKTQLQKWLTKAGFQTVTYSEHGDDLRATAWR